ncbi:MAG: dephospho-CoA kinase [Betaproteobacteria bacterium]
MLLIGLTGGIGSGKSAVADAFRALGVDVIDADEVAHALSAPGNDGYHAIVAAFGDAVLDADGKLDRAALRQRAFADPTFRAQLEALLHPLIAAHIAQAVARWRGDYGVVVAPLLLERGNLLRNIQRVLVVDCEEDEQLRRTVRRSGLSHGEVRAIMATQLTRDARLARADDVIDNSGAHAQIAGRVVALDATYRAIAASHA